MSEEEDGQPLAPRDALAAGEGFEDPQCPLAVVRCGNQADGTEVVITAIAVKEHDGKIVLAVPTSAWHRQVSRTLPKGFLAKVCAAEACGSALRSEALEGATVRVWLGLVEPTAEDSIQVPDDMPENVIGFGELSPGVPALPFVPALVAAAEDHFSFATGDSGRPAERDPIGSRLARLEQMLLNVMPQASAAGSGPKSKAKAKVRASPVLEGSLPELDPAVVAAAKAAGVSEGALAEMELLMKKGRGSRLRPEPVPPGPRPHNPLDESEEEDDDGAGVGSGAPLVSSVQPGPGASQAEAFAAAMFRMMEGYHRGSAKAGSSLERALDGAGSGSGEASSLPGARRNSAARKALRDALTTSPDELTAVIENLMAEDLASAAPGVAVPGRCRLGVGWSAGQR